MASESSTNTLSGQSEASPMSADDSAELSSDVVEKNVLNASKAKKSIANRLKYFKMHAKLLKVENGKVIDPYGHTLHTMGDKADFKGKIDKSDSHSSRESKYISKGKTSLTRLDDSLMSTASDDYQQSLEKMSKAKMSEEVEKKVKQFHSVRMKKLLTIDNLVDYLGTLEKQKQQRLLEEHRKSFRKFKYGGPSREGPLFCLREKFRRSRKEWRVKHAKMYGVFCRRVRLEKRLMRKANRLVTRERILNALKDKTKTKLLVLLEMKHEFKKLVEKLRLNKEIQEKIKRQESLRKHLTKPRELKSVRSKGRSSKAATDSSVKGTKMETGETQRSVATPDSGMQTENLDSSIRKQLKMLPPLPKPPLAPESTAQSNSNRSVGKKSLPPEKMVSYNRVPIATTDEKQKAIRHKSRDSFQPHSKCRGPSIANAPKAKVANSNRRELPLVQDTKYGALPVQQPCDSPLKIAAREEAFDKYKNTEVRHKIPKTEPKSESGKCAFLPHRILPGGYIRKFEVDSISRFKYKPEKDMDDIFEPIINHCRKVLNDELKINVEGSRSSLMDSFARDLTTMGDFILDHLHLLPPQDLESIVKHLVDLRQESFQDSSTCLSNVLPGSVVKLRDSLRLSNDEWKKMLESRYNEFLEQQKQAQNRHWISKQSNKRSVVLEERKKPSKKTTKMLADRLLLKRTKSFNNPVRVTTKLGGNLMLQGWKFVSYERYLSLGKKLAVNRSGWRKDGMEDYEVIIPSQLGHELKYYLILNRLDLTPRRFHFPGYSYDPDILKMMSYCSSFYRTNMLKRGETKSKHSESRNFLTMALSQGSFRVPHLRHRIFSKFQEKVTRVRQRAPPMFSKREELPDYDEDDPKMFRVRLVETQTMILWSFESQVAEAGTEEANKYLKDKRRRRKYRNRFHRTFDHATQTNIINYIERGTQLFVPSRDSKKTGTRETDIINAYKEPPPSVVKIIRKPGFQMDDLSDSSTELSESSEGSFHDETTALLTSSEFERKMKLTLRIMDSQLYSDKQLTFRKGQLLDPLNQKSAISYSHERLFSFVDKRIALSEFLVTSMDWSSINSNLLAVGYARHPLYPEQDKGMICIWNVKMVTKYEKKFEFKSSVTHLEFSVPHPRLLNVALMDGSVMILDLGAKRNVVLTSRICSTFSDFRPVWQFSWMEVDKDYFVPLTCGDNGLIHQLRPDGTFQPSKFLSLGHREGNIKGIKVSSSMGLKPRIKGRPGVTCIEKHPTIPVLYLAGSSDGCVHICSVHFRNQHLDVFLAHVGAVKGIKFHPHCEHVFMTYGEDFYVRIWLYGTFEPVLELMSGYSYVRCAVWSNENPEILVNTSGKFVSVWDIRRKSDSPIHKFQTPRQLENTSLKFDKSGRNILVGTMGGDVHVYSLKEMPFSPHFKGEAIANALEKVLKAKRKFGQDMKKLGYPFGALKDQLGE